MSNGKDPNDPQWYTIEQKIKAKLCDECWGRGNFCINIKGKSICGLCQLEGYE